MKSKSEIAEGAIEILDEKGWCQGTEENLRGQVCAGEALVRAAEKSYNPAHGWVYRAGSRAEWLKLHTLMVRVAPWSPTLPTWNDLRSTTVEAVRDRLMTVAKELREEGR